MFYKGSRKNSKLQQDLEDEEDMVDPRQQQQRMSQISMDEDFEPEQNGNQTGIYVIGFFSFSILMGCILNLTVNKASYIYKKVALWHLPEIKILPLSIFKRIWESFETTLKFMPKI